MAEISFGIFPEKVFLERSSTEDPLLQIASQKIATQIQIKKACAVSHGFRQSPSKVILRKVKAFQGLKMTNGTWNLAQKLISGQIQSLKTRHFSYPIWKLTREGIRA
ncbi:hypothetical protein IEQ34_002106 [Dendrobium chrysotoxum]|uniref:Uncharacterized protein n=1 Tax=Dendrobium chrysotoxum TaxID=161865 RepID=A0AAV7HMB6_DENCH|nr:hypothetical protein IEQ34_002106 [Dendrobium chrysotoxum]